MTKPKEDLLKIKEYVLVASRDRSIELYGKVQLLCHFCDMVDYLRFDFKPLIGRYPWPKDMVKKLLNPPAGYSNGEAMLGVTVSYDVPLERLAPELRARRGKILSAMRQSRIAYDHLKPWLDAKQHLDSCREESIKTKVVDLSSVVKAIDEKLSFIEAEIRKQKKSIKMLRPDKEEERNELLCRNIAQSLGIEEGDDLVLVFGTKNHAYFLPIRNTPLHPVGC